MQTYHEDELDRDLAQLDASWNQVENKYVRYQRIGKNEPYSFVKMAPNSAATLWSCIFLSCFLFACGVFAVLKHAPSFILFVICFVFASVIYTSVAAFCLAIEYEVKFKRYQSVRGQLIVGYFNALKRKVKSENEV
ncbi:MAG: hypothetical protein WCT04_15230 [Planctomycetota bacterium]